MSDRLTISRKDLVDIATEAMKDSGITEEQHIEMCETAHKTDTILMGGWVNEKCGCLVGTAFRNELAPGTDCETVMEKFGDNIFHVGLEFDRLLGKNMATNYGRYPADGIVYVDD